MFTITNPVTHEGQRGTTSTAAVLCPGQDTLTGPNLHEACLNSEFFHPDWLQMNVIQTQISDFSIQAATHYSTVLWKFYINFPVINPSTCTNLLINKALLIIITNNLLI